MIHGSVCWESIRNAKCIAIAKGVFSDVVSALEISPSFAASELSESVCLMHIGRGAGRESESGEKNNVCEEWESCV